MNESVICGYCDIEMHPEPFTESRDELGGYIAETFTCPSCGYRLERNPVYIDVPNGEELVTKIVNH